MNADIDAAVIVLMQGAVRVLGYLEVHVVDHESLPAVDRVMSDP
jgi:hypothetical protein